MLVAFPIESLLMSAESRHPVFNFFAKGGSGNRRFAWNCRGFNGRIELFKLGYGGGFSLYFSLRYFSLRLFPGDRLHERQCLRD